MKPLRLLCALLAIGISTKAAQSQSTAERNLPSRGSYKSVMLLDAQSTGSRLVALAQAMPVDRFTWRPSGDGFPSVSELYLVAATLFYHRPREWGAPRAAGYEYEGNDSTGGRKLAALETATTDKAQVVHELIDALAYFKGITKTLSDSDMLKPTKISGDITTPCQDLFVMIGDLHEFLSRAIDCAGMNSVALPWKNPRDFSLPGH